MHLASHGATDTDDDIGCCRFLPDDVKVMIKTSDFKDFHHRYFHLGGKRDKMRRRDLTVFILHQVKEFDQQVPAPRPRTQQFLDLARGHRINGMTTKLCDLFFTFS